MHPLPGLGQVYRDKVKAAAEGRPFTAPPPSQLQVSLGGSSRNSSSSALGGATGAALGGAAANGPSGKGHDDWGAWDSHGPASNGSSAGRPPAGGAAANGGFSSNSEYSRAQYMASAANKDEFFARKMQENNSRPDHLPPSQGGKFVGFGSTPAPRAGGGGGGGAPVDDVAQLLSKGLSSLGQVAGMAASTATVAVSQGTQGLNQLLAEKQVAATLQQTQKVVAEKAQVGWLGLKGLYANVASSVETIAKDSGYAVNLGSKAVASSLQQQRFEQQVRAGAYPGLGGGADAYGGGGQQYQHHSASSVHKSASEGAALGSHGSSYQQQQQPRGAGAAGSNGRMGGGDGGGTQQQHKSGGFGGFDDGADNGEWLLFF
jgi:ADP-ribosylation factor GTPase-activating protein 1